MSDMSGMPSMPGVCARRLVFPLWLAGFYAAWIVVVVAGGHARLALDHWPMALAMAAGSYVAGATPLGGGTIAFPILVLAFDHPATIGRDFAFAVQSIGMISATIWILVERMPLARSVLAGSIAGAAIGTPLGLLFIAPLASGLTMKLAFAVLWCAFGLLHFVRLGEIVRARGLAPSSRAFDLAIGFGLGLVVGATVVAVTGVGVNMMVYVVLVLVLRADLRIAVPTAVVAMAATSVVGMLTRIAEGGIAPEVWANLLAAAPVVVVGAPLGALAVRHVPRRATILVVSALCVLQFVWTCAHERVGPWTLAASLTATALCGLLFAALSHCGQKRGQPPFPGL